MCVSGHKLTLPVYGARMASARCAPSGARRMATGRAAVLQRVISVPTVSGSTGSWLSVSSAMSPGAPCRPVRSEDVIYNVNGIRVKKGLLLPANKAQFGG